jgi:nucleoside-diphosphate-sugar epimerase
MDMSGDHKLHVVVGGGPLGSAVVRELCARNEPVRLVTRSGKAKVPEGVEVRAANMADPDSARSACERASVIYHCVGAPYPDWVKVLPSVMAGVIEAAGASGARVVYGDNLYAYGPISTPITEDLPYAARGPKGRVRVRVAESLMKAHEAGRIRATVGRASDFYGPRVLYSFLGRKVFSAALKGGVAAVVGDPDMPHTYSFVGDFGRGLVTLGERDEALGETWHVPNARTVTTRRFVEMIFHEAGTRPRLRSAPRWLVTLGGLFSRDMREIKEMLYEFEHPFIVDHSKFERAFGADPLPHSEAIRRTLDWYRGR